MNHLEYWTDESNSDLPRFSHRREAYKDWDKHGRDVAALYRYHFNSTAGETILDWGCGGGAVSAALMSNGAGRIYGVDISERNLSEAKKEVGVRFHPVLIREPEDVDVTPVDAIVSTACFQHFPEKGYATRVLNVMRRCLVRGGFALIQMRYDNGSPAHAYRPELPYEENAIHRCSWPLDVFWRELESAGFVPSIVRLNREINYGWFVCRG